MKKAIFLALTIVVFSLPLAAWAQEKETKPSDETEANKVIKLKYADPPVVRTLLFRLGFEEEAKVMDDKAGIIIIRGSKSHVQAVEDIVKQMDVPLPPAKNVELTAYVLQTYPPPVGEAAALPPELTEVVAELKKVLNYKVFSLLSTLMIRTRDGEGGGTKGAAATPPGAADLELHFQWLRIDPGEKAPTVRVQRLVFEIFQNERRDNIKGEPVRTLAADIATSLDVPVGQKVVVGKTSWGSPDNAIILVITARIMD